MIKLCLTLSAPVLMFAAAVPIPDFIPDWLEKGGTRLLLAVIAWMAITGKIVWGPKAEERERAERENGEKWEKRFMDAFHYSRESQRLVERTVQVAQKAVEKV